MASVPRLIVGVVNDAAGRPVAQARVYFLRGPVPLPEVAALSDNAGGFVLTAPQAGDYEVGCSSEGHGAVAQHVTVGKVGATLELRLPA